MHKTPATSLRSCSPAQRLAFFRGAAPWSAASLAQPSSLSSQRSPPTRAVRVFHAILPSTY
eukprot:4936917-Prymnesium_polylepis.1